MKATLTPAASVTGASALRSKTHSTLDLSPRCRDMPPNDPSVCRVSRG